MAEANQSMKSGDSKTAKLLGAISTEPGILSSALRLRADEFGMTPDAVSQALYALEKAERVHYGESEGPRNRPCFIGRSNTTVRRKRTAGRKTKATQKEPQALQETYAVSLPVAAANPPVSAPSLEQIALLAPMGNQGSVGDVIANFASQLAVAIAGQVGLQVREQLKQQIGAEVTSAVADEMNKLAQAIPSFSPAPRNTRPAASPAGRKSPGHPRKKVVIQGLTGRFADRIETEFSGGIDLAFIDDTSDTEQVKQLLAEADEVVSMSKASNRGQARLLKEHAGLVKLDGGIPRLREKLSGLSTA